MPPNVPDRLAYSVAKAASAEPVPVEVVHVPVRREPCRGGCGELVGAGMKCVACATRAVEEWAARNRRGHAHPDPV